VSVSSLFLMMFITVSPVIMCVYIKCFGHDTVEHLRNTVFIMWVQSWSGLMERVWGSVEVWCQEWHCIYY